MRVKRSGIVAGLVAGATALVVGVATAGPAAAVGAFATAVTGGTNCQDAKVKVTGTTLYGVMRCATATGPNEIVMFRSNGTTTTRFRTGYNGKPIAFGDDGTSYFAMYTPADQDGRVWLIKRNHSTGAQTRTTLSTNTTSVEAEGAIVATGGRYWAVWSLRNEARSTGFTYTRQTLTPSLPTSLPQVAGHRPALALRGTTTVTLVVADGGLSSGEQIVRYLPSTATDTWSRTVMRQGNAFLPAVQYSGGVTRMAWLELVDELGHYTLVYQDNASGSWARKTVSTSGWLSSAPKIVTSNGNVTVAWTGRNAGSPLSETHVVVAQRVAGTWTTRNVTDGTAANRFLRLSGAGSWGGRAVVVMENLDGGTVTLRRQG